MPESRKRDSDVSEFVHPPNPTPIDLSNYRIKQLERAMSDLEERVDGLEAALNDMKVWRGYVLGAAATAGVLVGLIFSILGLIPWKK